MIIEATYKGKDGDLGYRKGETYKLDFKVVEVEQMHGEVIKISSTDEHNPKVQAVIYQNLKVFLQIWNVH